MLFLKKCLPVLTLLVMTLSSGCGLLIGSVKPVDEKAEDYGYLDLSKTDQEWAKLPPSTLRDQTNADDPTGDTAMTDVAFQSKKTASIISLNSACRPTVATHEQNLRSFTNLLFLGMTDVTHRDEKDLTVDHLPALQTTVQGSLNGEQMMLRAVVLRKNSCVYDLMYVSRPDHFRENEPDFSQFVASLKLK